MKSASSACHAGRLGDKAWHDRRKAWLSWHAKPRFILSFFFCRLAGVLSFPLSALLFGVPTWRTGVTVVAEVFRRYARCVLCPVFEGSSADSAGMVASRSPRDLCILGVTFSLCIHLVWMMDSWRTFVREYSVHHAWYPSFSV